MATTGGIPSTLKLDVVTPEALLFSGDVNMVEVPGAEGVFGVLPGHMPLIALVSAGMVKVQASNGNQSIFITSGLAEVNEQGCVILADGVIDPQSLSIAQAKEKLAEAELQRDNASHDILKMAAERQVGIYTAYLKAIA